MSLTVAETGCRYHKRLTYDTEFVVRTRLEDFRYRLLSFQYDLLLLEGETPFARGSTKLMGTGSDGQPRRIPEPYTDFLRGVRG